MNLKSHLKEKIAKNQFEEVFEALKQQLGASKTALNNLISLQGQFQEARGEALLGRRNLEDTNLIFNRIRTALLLIIDELPDKTTENEGSQKSTEVSDLERSGWNTQTALLVKKINRIREALILEDDPGRQFKYEQQIEQLETQLQQLKDRLSQ